MTEETFILSEQNIETAHGNFLFLFCIYSFIVQETIYSSLLSSCRQFRHGHDGERFEFRYTSCS